MCSKWSLRKNIQTREMLATVEKRPEARGVKMPEWHLVPVSCTN